MLVPKIQIEINKLLDVIVCSIFDAYYPWQEFRIVFDLYAFRKVQTFLTF